MTAEWPLVGRDDELEFIVGALGGPERGVVLIGPPGVGKTRLAGEAEAWARSHGLATVWIAATATTAQIPFGAMAPLMSDAIVSQTDRFRTLTLGCNALIETAGGKRLVLCVDDAHLLDPLSAALVHQAITSGSAMLLATVRRDHPVPHDVTALWKDGRVARLEITGLSRSESERLVESVLGGSVHGATMERLWNVTAGNTLFLREMIVSAVAAGDLIERDGVWVLEGRFEPGQGLIDLVALRLASLTARQERVIEYVALAEPVDTDIITATTSAADLEDAERSGAIAVLTEGDRLRVRLSHPLYGEVVRARTPALRTRAMIRDLADAVEARGGQRPDEILAMATWRLDSGGDCALDVLLAASRQARNLFDYRLAERLARAAVTMHGGVAASLARANCLYLSGRFAEAETQLNSVNERDATDRERVDIAITRASNLMWGLGEHDTAERLLIDVSLRVTEPDPLDDLHGLHARLALARARLPDVLDLTERVLSRTDAEPLARLSAAAARAPALVLGGRSTDALALLDEYRTLAIDHIAEFPQGVAMMLISRVSAHWFAGNLDRAAQEASDLYDLGISLQSWDAICAGARSRAWVELERGRPRTAMRWALEAVAAIPDGDLNGSKCGCLSMLAEAAAVAADPSVGQVVAKMDTLRRASIRIYDPQLALSHAWVAAMTGELTAAASAVHDGATEMRATGALAAECHLLHSAVRFDRPVGVADRLVELALLIDGPWAGTFADHAIALIAQDPHELERVASTFASLGAMLLAAEAAAQAARAFRRNGLERSRRAAATRSAAWAAQCEGSRTPALSTPEAVVPLTRRENEIAALAGQGLSSPDIARRLTLSTRTVEGHLHRLYAKLGVTRREDLDDHRAQLP